MAHLISPTSNVGSLNHGESLAVDYREAGRLLGVSSRTVWALCHSGELAAISIGRSRRILHSELERYVANRLAAAQFAHTIKKRPRRRGIPAPKSLRTSSLYLSSAHASSKELRLIYEQPLLAPITLTRIVEIVVRRKKAWRTTRSKARNI